MIGNIKDQNKALSDAGKKPVDTSYRTDDAIKYSATVATSNRQGKSENREANFQIKTDGAKKVRGSFEGLVGNRSAYLQPNGVGYDNKALQKARYSQSVHSSTKPNIDVGSLINSKNYSIMNNYSLVSSKDSSSDRLNNIVKNNMMFK